MEPTEAKDSCRCTANRYDAAAFGLIKCKDESTTSEPTTCKLCPSCYNCADTGVLILKQGWTFCGPRGQDVAGEDLPVTMVYKCPLAEACPRRVLNTTDTTVGSEDICAEGYAGPTCGAMHYDHLYTLIDD